MIVVTGAAGFIGSTLIQKLNRENFNHIVAVDQCANFKDRPYLKSSRTILMMDRSVLHNWLNEHAYQVEFIFHLGAITDTMFDDVDELNQWNTSYSQMIWNACTAHQIPLIYASSAATYGDGSSGFSDEHQLIPSLKPLNAYGHSKQEFDEWAIQQKNTPLFWAGLKFFNVYGANEIHKGRMASMVYQMIHQAEKYQSVRLYKSTTSQLEDGAQSRDFIFIQDVVDLMYWLMHHRKNSGIYNAGSGHAMSFRRIAKLIFSALNLPENIEWIDMPESVKPTYQNFTKAEIKKIKSIGYPMDFTLPEEGIPSLIKALFSRT